MKHIRYTRKYVIHLPRIAIREPGIYEITIKNPTLVIEKVGEVPKSYKKPRDGTGLVDRDYLKEERPPRGSLGAKDGSVAGEIERGFSDTDE